MHKIHSSNECSYYKDFSKYILHPVSHLKPTEDAYKYKDWLISPNSINALSLKELKRALKNENEPSSGNKPILKARLLRTYNTTLSVIKIQRVFRRYLVTECERLKGPGYKCRKKCVNEHDFYTMDNIPNAVFFSYANEDGFVYGFNVFSLMHMFKTSRKIINPYTREDISIKTVCDVFSLYKKIEILHPLEFAKNGMGGGDTNTNIYKLTS
jgi:hypothetical protein